MTRYLTGAIRELVFVRCKWCRKEIAKVDEYGVIGTHGTVVQIFMNLDATGNRTFVDLTAALGTVRFPCVKCVNGGSVGAVDLLNACAVARKTRRREGIHAH